MWKLNLQVRNWSCWRPEDPLDVPPLIIGKTCPFWKSYHQVHSHPTAGHRSRDPFFTLVEQCIYTLSLRGEPLFLGCITSCLLIIRGLFLGGEVNATGAPQSLEKPRLSWNGELIRICFYPLDFSWCGCNIVLTWMYQHWAEELIGGIGVDWHLRNSQEWFTANQKQLFILCALWDLLWEGFGFLTVLNVTATS